MTIKAIRSAVNDEVSDSMVNTQTGHYWALKMPF